MAQSAIFRGTARAIFNEGNVMRFKYHNTVIVRYDLSSGMINLDNGGYRTATTKLAMNQASNQFNLGFSVYQHKHEWFVRMRNGYVIPFTNGMSFSLEQATRSV